MDHVSDQAGPTSDIDEGFRAWYASCPCCLGDAHPAVKAALDVEAAEHASTGGA